MNETYFLKVINRGAALVLEHEGHQIGESGNDGSVQVNFPLVGMRILLPNGLVANRQDESWSDQPVTSNPITLASL